MKWLAWVGFVVLCFVFSSPLRSEAAENPGLLLDYAKLTKAVYTEADVPGWTKFRAGNDPFSGLQWVVYQKSLGNGKVERALVFAGTKGFSPFNILRFAPDFSNNVNQGLNLTPFAAQYTEAAGVAEREFQDLPGGTSFVILGHSLGGGLAEFAAAFLGVRGISFNGAPLSPESLNEIAEHWISDPVTSITLPLQRYATSFPPFSAGIPNPEMARIEGPLLNAVGDNILNVVMDGDPVQSDVGVLGARHIGRPEIIEPAPGTPTDPLSLHMPDALIAAIEFYGSAVNSPSLADALLGTNWSAVRDMLKSAADQGSSAVVNWLSANAALYTGDIAAAANGFSQLGNEGNGEACQRWVKSLMSVRGEDPVIQLLSGDALVREGRYLEALDVFNQGLATSQGNALLLNARGSLYALMKAPGAAQSDFHKAFPAFYSQCGGVDERPCAPPAQFPCPDGTPHPCTCGQGHPCPPAAQSLPPPCPPQLCGGSPAGGEDPFLRDDGGGGRVASDGPGCPNGSLPACRGGVAMTVEISEPEDLDFSTLSGSPRSQRDSETRSGLTKPTLIYSNLVFKR
ncbi:MAG: hypothetical protein ACLQVL_11740 [Terriglobia bacterium]